MLQLTRVTKQALAGDAARPGCVALKRPYKEDCDSCRDKLFAVCCMMQEPLENHNAYTFTLEALPADLQRRVLAAVPLQQRIGDFTSTSRSMQAAAVAATQQLHLEDISQNTANAFTSWLLNTATTAFSTWT
jgi:hypothetical protein